MNTKYQWETIKSMCKNLKPLEQTKQFTYREDFVFKKSGETKIRIVNDDCIAQTLLLKDQGLNPVMLNMCNPLNPGGNPTLFGSQEESIFRRTDLSLCLSNDFYPQRKLGIYYSPRVRVLCLSEKQPIFLENNQPQISVLSMAALMQPPVCDNRILPPYSLYMEMKIASIFQVAYSQGHDSIVLGALGCGAFGNPPEHICDIFMKQINNVGNSFKSIVFAILDFENDQHSNFNVFKKHFT
jgi:uncharacterized protein (TIGR02452 family)